MDFGSSQQAWATLKAETETLSRKHTENADRIVESIGALGNDLKTTAKAKDKLEAQGKKVLRDLQSAEAKEAAAKTNFERLRIVQDQTQEEYERAKFNNPQSKLVDKLGKKLKSDCKKAAAADASYIDTVHKLAQTQTKAYREELPRVLDELQRLEEQRITVVRQTLLTFCAISASTAPEISNTIGRVESAADAISPNGDIAAFVAEKKTGAVIPPPAQYEPYDPETKKCVPKAAGSSSSPGPRAVSVYDAQPMRDSIPPSSFSSAPIPSAAAPVASSYHSEPTPQYIGRCRALFTYEPQDPSELAFNEGDIINVLQKDDSGWWQGELNGEIKVFPFNDWCEEID